MAELSRRSEVAVPTIKFYLRERLLAVGHPTGANQADYGDQHVRRLRLIRAMAGVGGMSLAQVREVVGTIDSDQAVHDVLGTMQKNLPGIARPVGTDAVGTGSIEQVIAERGWHGYPSDRNGQLAEEILTAWQQMIPGDYLEVVRSYAAAAEIVAEIDLAGVAAAADRDSMIDYAVVGTIFGDALFAALRRVAQVHLSDKHFSAADPAPARNHRPTPPIPEDLT